MFRLILFLLRCNRCKLTVVTGPLLHSLDLIPSHVTEIVCMNDKRVTERTFFGFGEIVIIMVNNLHSFVSFYIVTVKMLLSFYILV